MSGTLVKIYSSVDRALKINLQGITHADSIKHIENCNSINWLMGHMVVSRNGILNLMGIAPVAPERIKTVYERGSKMMTDMGLAENFDTLVKFFDEAQVKILEGVTKVSDKEVKEKLAFLGFHEGYHVGQIGTMRKLIGKEGAIK